MDDTPQSIGPNSMAETSAQGRTQKFRDRQAAILRVAVELINRKGVRGTTLANVAARLGIVPTGVIYYFASKEDLAGACFMQAIEAYEELASRASAGRTRHERLRLFVEGYFALAREVALGRRARLVVFNDVRALDDPAVNAAYTNMFRRVRDLLTSAPPTRDERHALNPIAHLVLSQLPWSVLWLPLYEPRDYGRVAARTLDILLNGLAAEGSDWVDPPMATVEAEAAADASHEAFLRAATQTINEHGYLGASVEKISARMNLTKRSFYYHNEAKDDLVVACFRRTLDVLRHTQRLAIERETSGWGQIACAASALVYCQASGATPLLRASALTSTPEAVQGELVGEFDRVSLNFCSMISEGIIDGSLRPVDAHIGAQLVTAMINAAAELEHWAPGLSPTSAARAYVRALLHGIDRAIGS